MGDFYLTLPSNSSMKHFPNNSPAHFYTELPQSIDLSSKEYEVGLAEIQFPNTYTNLDEGWIQVSLSKNKQPKQIPLPKGLYDSPSTLVKTLNKLLSKHQQYKSSKEQFVNIIYNRAAKRVAIELYLEGSQLRLSPQMGEILGMNDSIMFVPGKFDSKKMVDIHKHSYAVYDYCNLVTARQVGDMLVPLLRIVPTIDKTKYIIYHTFEKPHYLSLNRHQFNNIEIVLRGDTGRTPAFASGTSVVTLHLRPRKN